MINGNNMYAQNIGTNMQNTEGVFLKEPVPAPDLIEKSITENGEYNASADNADGYSKVTVDVAGGGGGETFEVNATLETDPLTVTIDQNFDDVWEAISAGKKIVGTLTVDSDFITNCVGVSTIEFGGTEGIFFMYEAFMTQNGLESATVGCGKQNDKVYYYVENGPYQLANN